MIDPTQSWIDGWDNLPLVTDSSWADNIANLIQEKSSGLEIAPPVFLSGASWTWQKSIFKAGIQSMAPTGDKITAANTMASAWKDATLASMLTASTGYVGASTPATSWLGPPAIIIDPSSVNLGYVALFAALKELEPTAQKGSNPIPAAFRAAFTVLKFNLTGVNQIPPPAGPQPLMAMSSGVQ